MSSYIAADEQNHCTSDWLVPRRSRATQLRPRWDLLRPGDAISIDGEWQWYLVNVNGVLMRRFRWGRVAVVNPRGEVIFDAFFNYWNEDKVNQKTPSAWNWKFGVQPTDLLTRNGAIPGGHGERILKQLMHGRTVVVHDENGEKKAFYYENDAWDAVANGVTIEDTQKLYAGLSGIRKPGLDKCVAAALDNTDFRASGEHCPVEDALATMKLYLEAPAWRSAQSVKDADAEAHQSDEPVERNDSPLEDTAGEQTSMVDVENAAPQAANKANFDVWPARAVCKLPNTSPSISDLSEAAVEPNHLPDCVNSQTGPTCDVAEHPIHSSYSTIAKTTFSYAAAVKKPTQKSSSIVVKLPTSCVALAAKFPSQHVETEA